MKRVTIKDIALAAGISVNSVSRALRGKSDISERTRQIVLQKAEELGYVKNIIASSLRSKSTMTIAVLYDYLLNPYYSVMTAFLERALSEHGYRIMIFSESSNGAFLNENILKSIISHNADGIISFLQADGAAKADILSTGIKTVILGRESDGLNCVVSDDVKGGYAVTKHLIDKGHTKILFLCSDPEVSCGMRRLEGYKNALNEAGLPVDDGLVLYWGKDYFSVSEAADRCKVKGKTYTAAVCFNDFVAFEAIKYFSEKGLRVPEDIAITGYDNIQSELNLFGQITTVETNKRQMAKEAVNMLMGVMNSHNTKVVKRTMGITLIQGYTT